MKKPIFIFLSIALIAEPAFAKVPKVCVDQSGQMCYPGAENCFTLGGEMCNPAGLESKERLGPDITDDQPGAKKTSPKKPSAVKGQ
jgi:hypothetical protein